MFKVVEWLSKNKGENAFIRFGDLEVIGDLGNSNLIKWWEKKLNFSELRSKIDVTKWRVGCGGKERYGMRIKGDNKGLRSGF